jgi:nucleoside-diphosphate-sugar epimerase
MVVQIRFKYSTVYDSHILEGGRMKNALVCGSGGFIGSHLAKRLKDEGYWVRSVDSKRPEFASTAADDFQVADLRDTTSWEAVR